MGSVDDNTALVQIPLQATSYYLKSKITKFYDAIYGVTGPLWVDKQ